MKKCTDKKGILYFSWAWYVSFRGEWWASDFYYNLEDVKKCWQRLQKKYPNKRLHVHRMKLVDGVDDCMQRREVERLCSVLKGLAQANGNICIDQSGNGGSHKGECTGDREARIYRAGRKERHNA